LYICCVDISTYIKRLCITDTEQHSSVLGWLEKYDRSYSC